MTRERTATCAAVQSVTRPYDALLIPTTPSLPLPLDGLEGIDTLMKASARVLRNTALSNYLDRPTITMPCHKAGSAPVGLSLMGSCGHDRRLLAVAAAVEPVVRG